jgi:hypothetical protein
MSNILNIAWKFDHDSAFDANTQVSGDTNFNYSFRTCDATRYPGRVFSLFGYLSGIVSYFYNKLRCLASRTPSGQLVTLVKRNYFSEIMINHIVSKYKIDEINIHWVGYGFLPTNSIGQIRRCPRVNVFHHDWYHFTSGEHVPVFNGGVSLIKVMQRNKLLSAAHIKNVCVSSFQGNVVRDLGLLNCVVTENTLRDAFVKAGKREDADDIFVKRLNYCSRFVIVFIGVTAGNNDNKGLSTALNILKNCVSSDVLSIGIGCDGSLPVNVSLRSLGPESVFRVLSSSDLTIITSRLETFSMVALESQFCRTPVLFRASLAPSTFKNSNFLCPSPDDSDDALIGSVVGLLSRKRSASNA